MQPVPANRSTGSSSPHVVMAMTDECFRFMWVNRLFTVVTGYALKELHFKRPEELVGREGETHSMLELMSRTLHLAQAGVRQRGNSAKQSEVHQTVTQVSDQYRVSVDRISRGAGLAERYLVLASLRGDLSVHDGKVFHLRPSQYRTSSLSSERSTRLFARLEALMEAEHSYRDPRASLAGLAAKLETNKKYLSQVVNQHTGPNLQPYLNTYRVRDVKSTLLDAELSNLTYSSIAEQSGFRNKSTFYKVFKSLVGLTPKTFVERHHARQCRSKPTRIA